LSACCTARPKCRGRQPTRQAPSRYLALARPNTREQASSDWERELEQERDAARSRVGRRRRFESSAAEPVENLRNGAQLPGNVRTMLAQRSPVTPVTPSIVAPPESQVHPQSTAATASPLDAASNRAYEPRPADPVTPSR
jgi:hypothetical protein